MTNQVSRLPSRWVASLPESRSLLSCRALLEGSAKAQILVKERSGTDLAQSSFVTYLSGLGTIPTPFEECDGLVIVGEIVHVNETRIL